jgi:hypothetical protein
MPAANFATPALSANESTPLSSPFIVTWAGINRQTAEVTANGRHAASWSVSGDAREEVAIPAECLYSDGTLILSFQIDSPVIPNAIDMYNRDKRALGFKFKSMKLIYR